MDSNKVSELRKLFEEVMCAPTKEAAKAPLRRLEFMVSTVTRDIDPYLVGKLREAISYAADASGMGRSKAHWISCAEQCWYVFETGANR